MGVVRDAKRLARSAVLAPVWTAQLATGAKSFMDNPLIGSPRLNAWGLHARRVQLADRLAQSRRRRLAHLISAADRAAFDRDGFVVKEGFLPPAQFAAVLAEVQGHRAVGRETIQGNAVTRRMPLDPAALAQMPGVRALLRQPDWRGLIRYAGSYDAAPVEYIQTILTHAGSGPNDPQCDLHSDTFHSSVKAWLFLTDVPADEGPFVYVPGSHRLTPARLAWEHGRSVGMAQEANRLTRRGSFRVSAGELEAMGLPAPRVFAVPANTLVVADTYGFHARGPSVRPSRRVEIWAYGRRNPFLPWTGLDVWRIEALGQRRAPLVWRVNDLVARLGGPGRQWHPRAGVSPFDADGMVF
jgi:hypothetical protein